MDLICATCSQPNPAGAKLCSRCSSIFPPTTIEALSAATGSGPTGIATETLVDVARRPEAFASETLIAPSGAPTATGTPVAAASGGNETLVAAPSTGGDTIVAPSDAPPVVPQRRTPAPRTPSRGGTPAPGARFDAAAVAAGSLQPGDHLGSRYEIVKLLGKGGMGAVYLARDLDLGRDVAMKLIAPHLANDTGVLERFKREIQLSSIVTHQNVLRVYDLGESDGIKFLTMQYIEGETLADVISRERPLPLERTLEFFEQICEALAAAHEKGVLHRDLKPQNVMLDAEGHVYLMDFGLATSRAVTAMTQVGAIMGTPQYMSPEQVKGTQTDARSDIFSLGVMLYEMLSGELPFNGDSLFEIMIKRTQGPPRPVGELNPAVPEYLRQLLDRCLAVDPLLRYHDLQELLFDLQAGSVAAPIKKRRGPSRKTLVAGAALLAAVVAGGVVTTVARRAAVPRDGAAKPVTLLIADFDNRTGEVVLNGALEPALSTALEGASFITSFKRGTAQRSADRLKLEGTGLPEKRARLVAQREGIPVVTSGYVEPQGSGYRLGLRAVDAVSGQRVFEGVEDVSKDTVLQGVTKLAAGLRKKLGDGTPIATQLEQGRVFGAANLEAAHEYGVAQQLTSEGKYDEAKKHYLEAVKLDPDLGRAYADIAVLEANRGRRSEAEKYHKESLARLDRTTDRERYRRLGAYYTFTRDTDKLIEVFSALVKQYPTDYVGLNNLGLAYGFKADHAHALEYFKRASAIAPNDATIKGNVATSEAFTGDFDGALRTLQELIERHPNYTTAYVLMATTQLAAGQRDAAIATWDRIKDVAADGASIRIEGLADLAAYEGRIADARALLEEGIKLDLSARDNDGAARKQVALAELHLATNQRSKASAEAERALSFSTDTYVVVTAGGVLAEVGAEKRVVTLADELEKRLGVESRMTADLLRGQIEMKHKRFAEAINAFKAAVQKLDYWMARFALGRAYLEAGSYPAALDELELCEKRHGEAIDAFMGNAPTYRLYPAVRLHLARTYEALKNPSAADRYTAFLALKKSDEDPMVQDARKRLAALTAAAPVVPASAQK